MKLFIDTETGGLDPQVHSLLTIGLCAVNEDGKIIDYLQVGIKHDTYVVSSQALSVNNINLCSLNTTKADAFKMINNFINCYFKSSKIQIAGHNVNFDIGFLKHFWNENIKEIPEYLDPKEYNKVFDYHYTDTMQIAQFLKDCGVLKIKNVKLATLCEELGIVNQNAHTALSDAMATVEVYNKMMKLIKK